MLGLDDLKTLTVEEAAEVLGVHAETVRRYVREGRIEAMRWGGRLRFRSEAIRAFQDAAAVHVADPGDLIRRARGGRGRSGARRRARRGRPLPALSPGGRSAAAAQPGEAARPSPEQPAGPAPAEASEGSRHRAAGCGPGNRLDHLVRV
ncbi:MAG: helix-turn-helix domain-containing protein [Planctomycetota bacterium]|nr:helix-turn-helix domain-containing protein [Planctomycetota bacterium]